MGFLPGKSRLQILLDDKRMTQQELADRIGASKQQVNNWINGKLKMNLGNAKTVAMALGVQMDELYEWEFSPRPKEKKSGRRVDSYSPPKESTQLRVLPCSKITTYLLNRLMCNQRSCSGNLFLETKSPIFDNWLA